jgi:hypothetical protein
MAIQNNEPEFILKLEDSNLWETGPKTKGVWNKEIVQTEVKN